ncbi:MAG: PAS domain S-box protein, partial [Nitrospiria bacterium]
LKAGLDDYVIKSPKHAARLATAVRSALERSASRRSLRRSEERYRLLVEGIRDYAVFLVDPDGTIATWNSGAERIFGYAAEAVVGLPYSTLFRPEDRERGLPQRVLGGAQTSGSFEDEGWRRRRDGSQFWVKATATRLEEDGRLVGWSLLTRDLTERKRAEQEIQKAGKLESLGILAGGIAHDFNNLLTIIIGHISLARISLDPGTQIVRQLNAAVKAGIRAKDLTRQLLTFSTEGAPVKSLISLGGLLEEWVAFPLRGTSIRPRFLIDHDLWPVEADEGQINQVINNLVINAHQAMPAGGVLTVRAKNSLIHPQDRLPLAAGPYVRISITDQGPGIPHDQLAKIFDPFFTTKPRGTGLGLTTSYSIVKKHEGHIRVESASEGGATFDVYLPAKPRETAQAKPATTLSRTGTGKILLMDDEPAIRDFFQDLVRYLGYEVECVADGDAAVERFRDAAAAGRGFNLVILDLTVVGGMGGLDTLVRLRDLDPRVNAVVSSGYANDPALTDYRRFGFAGVIFKPYEIEDLSQILRAAMGG